MDVDQALATLACDGAASFDVAELALVLARDNYPELDVEAYLAELTGMAREARNYLGGNLDCRVAGLCRYLFHEMGYRGNKQDYYDAKNSYLNEVMDRRTGIPITLSILTMAIGQRLELPLRGVGLPGHFVVMAVEGNRHVLVDPFHGGRKLSPTDCENLVYQVTGQSFRATCENLRPLSVGLIIARLLTNLKMIYMKREEYAKAARVIARLWQLAPHDQRERRDLGAMLLKVGKAGQAIDHLRAYLASATSPPDDDSVQQLLDRAFAEVSKWN